jgi:hypothetical protein
MHAWTMVALALAAGSPATSRGAALAAELRNGLAAAEVADIYIIGRNLEFPMDLRPYHVMMDGCAYRVHRFSPQWGELERALADAHIRIVPASGRRQEVRFGLILSDLLGTILEIYSNDLDWPNHLRPGVIQRQRVEISPGFVTALRAFADRHPDLAVPSHNCAGAARR